MILWGCALPALIFQNSRRVNFVGFAALQESLVTERERRIVVYSRVSFILAVRNV